MDAVMECDAEQLQRAINEAEMAISNRMKGVAVDSPRIPRACELRGSVPPNPPIN